MKKMIVVFLLFTGVAVANNDKKDPAKYPLTAHVVKLSRDYFQVKRNSPTA
jgi:hypothetical protein